MLDVDPILGARKKEARRYGIRSLCTGLGKLPENASIDELEKALINLTPEKCGVSHRTMANNKSYVRQSLFAYRADLIDTRKLPWSPAWSHLFQTVADKDVVKACGRFARWGTSLGIEPLGVDQAAAENFRDELATRMLSTKSRAAYVRLCRGWNKAAAEYPAVWPQLRLAAGDLRRFTVLPRAQIDVNFIADLESMLSAFGTRLKMPKGFRKPYESSTLNELRRILLRLYSVGLNVCPRIAKLSSLSDLVRVDVAEAIIGFYLEMFGDENTMSAHKYAHYLYVVAKYWVGLPPAQLETLTQFRSRTQPRHTGMTATNRSMLRQFENDNDRVGRLLFQGAAELAKFNKIRRPGMRDALELQSALAIEILIAAPVRPQNLCSISLTRHLVRQRVGKRESIQLVFPADEVKNDLDLEFRLPERVTKLLRVYVDKALPLLAQAGNSHLFPGLGVKHKSACYLSQQIAKRTLRVLRSRVTGHRFRHLVGFLYLKDHPTGHEVVRKFLGHKRIETTIAFYAGMEQAAAIALYDEHIENLRRRFVAARPARGKRFSKTVASSPTGFRLRGGL